MTPSASASQEERRPHVRQLLLENGLQMVWEEDHRQPLIAIEARIKGGLRGEGAYVGTGITHFIEHMLFKGTPTRPAGSIEQEVRRYGGSINAFTSFDVTGVSLFVESRYLNESLAMLADILQHAVFPEDEFQKERAVVISEIQMNLDDPDRRVNQLFWSRHLLEHPYRHPILGYQPLLEKLTVDDLRSFYAAQYQPQNIVIACVGDLDGAAFPELARTLLGSWARGTTDPRQQLVVREPPVASSREAVVDLPIQAAYAIIGFSSTSLADPDLYPLDVLANIVGQGRSSRLYETVVRQRQLADGISAWNYTPYDPGVFGITLRAGPEKVAAAIQASLQVLEHVQQHGVTEQELRKAKAVVSAEYLFKLQSVESKAGDLADSLLSTGDPLFSRRYVAGVERVSAQQVREVAQRYCDPLKMTTAIISPSRPAARSAAPAAVQVALPTTKVVLGNGARIILGVDHALPIAALVVGFHGGVRVEDERHQGLSNLVAQLLTKGTKGRRAFEIAQYVESLGGTLQPFSGRDGFGVVLQVLAKDVDKGVSLLHELIAHSTFPEEELALQRQLVEKQLQAQEDEIFDMGGRLLRQTLFQRHPYRFNPLGDRATIGLLSRADCREFATRWLAPAHMVVAAFGDLDAEATTRQMERTFGALTTPGASWPEQLPEDPIEGIRQASQTMEREQALIMLGFRGSTHRAADRDTLDVMTAVLSGMSGRLFQSVREAHGLSYTLGAVHVPGWDPGYLLVYAATRPEEQARVVSLLGEQLELAAERGFTEEEVEQARRFLIGQHRLELQDLADLAKESVLDELYGLGFDAWASYDVRIKGVSVAMVNDAARRYLTMQRRAQVVISPNGRATARP